MKKLMSLVALAVVGSAVAALAEESTNVVLSANAVGYVKRTIPAGALQIVSIPFENIASTDGTYKFGDTQIAADLDKGDTVMFWYPESQVWSGGSKGQKGWSAGISNYVVHAGEAFFIRNNSGADIEVTAAGEVPSDATLQRAYAGGAALSTVASAYPVDVKFGETELANQLEKGDTVMFWYPESQVWSGGSKGQKGWSAGISNYVVRAGEGFFIKPAAEGTWEAAKPYEWP